MAAIGQKIQVDLEPWVRAIIQETVMAHQNQCPLYPRVREVEKSFARMAGLAIGAGAVGGLAVKLMGAMM